ncbi:MAG: MOSC domain-containing protein [Hyphomicrobiaceae bacterium]|nr:MOSC domain-containing protein [Hyphomicrobiaceae bacterium]
MANRQLVGLLRYPVKGLSPERLEAVMLSPGEVMPLDRAYAFENGPSGFDPDQPRHISKMKFLCLAAMPDLARLRSKLDEDGVTLTLEDDTEKARFDLSSENGAQDAAAFLARHAGEALRGPVRLCKAPGFSFSDTAKKVVSLINLASLRKLEAATGKPIDPIRFRGNIVFEGESAFEEHGWTDREIRIGPVLLKGLEPIMRCAATEVNLETATRDIAVPRILHGLTGAPDCGLYATVVEGGRIAVGDALTVI